jgi:hypothetical protein
VHRRGGGGADSGRVRRGRPVRARWGLPAAGGSHVAGRASCAEVGYRDTGMRMQTDAGCTTG